MEINAYLCLLLASVAAFIIVIRSECEEMAYEEEKILEIASKINYSRPSSMNLRSNLYEGDIYLSEEQAELLSLNMSIYRNAITDPSLLWPDNKVYYLLSSSYDERQISMISAAMEHIQSETCIQFVNAVSEAPPHGHSLVIDYNPGEGGCHSGVGFQPAPTSPSVQLVHLAPADCFDDIGTPEHELLHAVGLYHEQSRPDRDEYITILWQNIISNMTPNFGLGFSTTTFDIPYDYGSVMQYQNDAFSMTPGLPTMVAKKNPQICLGNRHLATQCDLEKIRRLYGCTVQNNCSPRVQCAVDNRCDLYS